MEELKKYEKDIYKCSRCGLCQSVCPIYKEFKNECLASKGKFNFLIGILTNKIKDPKKFKKYFELCLNCNACKNFCPSHIDIKKIFAAFRFYMKRNSNNCIEKLSCIFRTLKFKIAKVIFFILRISYLNKILLFFYKPLSLSILGKKLLLLSKISFKNFDLKKKNDIITSTSDYKNKEYKQEDFIFFSGCFNKNINDSSKNAAYFIFKKLGYDNIMEPQFHCCSVSSYYSGNLDYFKKIAKKNLDLIPKNAKYIIFDCDTCKNTFNLYKEIFTLDSFNIELISFTEFLIMHKNQIKTLIKENLSVLIDITYHLPCHGEKNTELIISDLLDSSYERMPNYDQCCGFAGDFGFRHPVISSALTKNKLININKHYNFILTSCPACQIGLESALIETNKSSKILNITEFFALLMSENYMNKSK